jgi:hypothetical protein
MAVVVVQPPGRSGAMRFHIRFCVWVLIVLALLTPTVLRAASAREAAPAAAPIVVGFWEQIHSVLSSLWETAPLNGDNGSGFDPDGDHVAGDNGSIADPNGDHVAGDNGSIADPSGRL